MGALRGSHPGGVLDAAPRNAFLKTIGEHEVHFHAGAMNRFAGLVELNRESAVRIRYRIDRPLNVGLFISTRSPTWDFTGNFQAYVQERLTPPDTDGWRTSTIPIGSFSPMAQKGIPFRPGCVAATVFATTYDKNVNLQLAELEIFRVPNE